MQSDYRVKEIFTDEETGDVIARCYDVLYGEEFEKFIGQGDDFFGKENASSLLQDSNYEMSDEIRQDLIDIFNIVEFEDDQDYDSYQFYDFGDDDFEDEEDELEYATVGVKESFNLREALNKIDLDTYNKYDLLNLYEACDLKENEKRALANIVYDQNDPSVIYDTLNDRFLGKEIEMPERVKDGVIHEDGLDDHGISKTSVNIIVKQIPDSKFYVDKNRYVLGKDLSDYFDADEIVEYSQYKTSDGIRVPNSYTIVGRSVSESVDEFEFDDEFNAYYDDYTEEDKDENSAFNKLKNNVDESIDESKYITDEIASKTTSQEIKDAIDKNNLSVLVRDNTWYTEKCPNGLGKTLKDEMKKLYPDLKHMYGESKSVKESVDEEPYTKEQIEQDLKTITNNFTEKEGELKCGFEEEKNFGVEILLQHYKVVEASGDGEWYHISYAEPLHSPLKEGVDEKVVEMFKDSLMSIQKEDDSKVVDVTNTFIQNTPDNLLSELLTFISDNFKNIELNDTTKQKCSKEFDLKDTTIDTIGTLFDAIDIFTVAEKHPKELKEYLSIVLTIISVLEPSGVLKVAVFIFKLLPDKVVAKVLQLINLTQFHSILIHLGKKGMDKLRNKNDDSIDELFNFSIGSPKIAVEEFEPDTDEGDEELDELFDFSIGSPSISIKK